MKFYSLVFLVFLLIFLLPAEEGVITINKQEIADTTAIKVHIFDDLEKDYDIAKLFLSSQQKQEFKKLNSDQQRIFLENFWIMNDPNPVTPENEFMQEIQDRVDYANKFFTHFKEGWTSDRGRILIKYGQPYEKIKDNTEYTGRFASKDYEIWKYRMNYNLTFIFIDIQTHGDYRLIYSDNDETEITLPDWRDYLGDNFDERSLY